MRRILLLIAPSAAAAAAAVRPGAGVFSGIWARKRTLLTLLALAIFGAAVRGVAVETATAEGLFEWRKLTGDWGGVRQQWEDSGVLLELNDTAETLANPIGGVKRQTIYEGLLALSLTLDLEKLAGWTGASFFVSGYQISGRGLSRNAVDNLLLVSSIEGLPSTRLFDLWLQQKFLDSRASLRAGQIAADDEFFISQYAATFINATFGWPDVMSENLPGGGPAYPLATPGARLRAAPTAALTFSAAAFNGDPAPPGPGDPQVRNSSGTNFLIGQGGWFLLAEAGYAFDAGPDSAAPLSAVKLGGWYHSGLFADQRRDMLGRSLADPESNGVARMRRGDFGFYLVADKALWRPPDAATQGLAAFLRVGGAPADRNPISLEVDAGVTYEGLFPGRELDVLGVAASYARIGGSARGLDRDVILFAGVARPVRDYEAVLEVTYKARLAPWWALQPDLQLVLHPGGHIADPAAASTAKPIPNAVVLGLRSVINF